MSTVKEALSADDALFRISNAYPNAFPVSLSHSEFPLTESSANEMGAPLGCVIKPFIPDADRIHIVAEPAQFSETTRQLARCSQCHAYINIFCDVTGHRWMCSLCGYRAAFTKSQLRYRQVDSKLLPELRSVMVDVPMPYRGDVDGVPYVYDGSTSIPASVRPLIHVFVIQESMPLDALQGVVEALNSCISDMHPDIQIVLVTFSNRIGIYRLSDATSHPSVQYVQFATGGGKGTIFEGHELHEMNASVQVNTANAVDGDGDSDDHVNKSNGQQNESFLKHVVPVVPLAHTVEFLQAAQSVGQCRNSALAAISSLFDAFPLNTNEGSSVGQFVVPQVLLGPTLEAISKWILKPSKDVNEPLCENVALVALEQDGVDEYEDEESVGGILGLLKSIIIGDEDSNSKRHRSARSSGGGRSARGMGGVGRSEDDALGPIDSCSGVIMHLFVSASQDIPPSAHESSLPSSTPSLSPSSPSFTFSEAWATQLGTLFSHRALAVNVTSVCSFESNQVGLAAISPLASLTGGKIKRFVMGAYPRDERIRLTAYLRNCVLRQVATRGILKLRSSSALNTLSVTGHICPDKELPHVYRMSMCDFETALGFQFAQKKTDVAENQKWGTGQYITAMQLAFSYDTLVESDEDLSPIDCRGITGSMRGSVCVNDDDASFKGNKERDNAHVQGSNHDDKDKDKDKDKYKDKDDNIDHSIEEEECDDGVLVNEGIDYDSHTQEAMQSIPAISESDPTDYVANAMEILALQEEVRLEKMLTAKLSHEQKQRQQREKKKQFTKKSRGDKEVAEKNQRFIFGASPLLFEHTQQQHQHQHQYQQQNSPAYDDHLCKYYNKKLVSVRRLRIITVAVECTSKVNRLISATHFPTVALLIARQALRDERTMLCAKYSKPQGLGLAATKSSGHHTDSSSSFSDLEKLIKESPGVELIMDWIVSLIMSTAIALHERSTASSSSSSSSSQQKGKTSKNVQISDQDKANYIKQAMVYLNSPPSYALRIFFGLLHYICRVRLKAASSQSFCDDCMTLLSDIEVSDAYYLQPLLYPQMFAIDKDGCLSDSPLSLGRESMITSGVNTFLLDAGSELVLYRNMAAGSKLSKNGGGVISSEKVNKGEDISGSKSEHEVSGSNSKSGEPSVVASTRQFSSLPLPPPPPPPPSSFITLPPPSLNPTLSSITTSLNAPIKPPAPSVTTSASTSSASSSSTNSTTTTTTTSSSVDKNNSQHSQSEDIAASPPTSTLPISKSQLLTWLPVDIQRRLLLSPLQRNIFVAEAGRSSAGHFTQHLIEDGSSLGITFATFQQYLMQRALDLSQ